MSNQDPHIPSNPDGQQWEGSQGQGQGHVPTSPGATPGQPQQPPYGQSQQPYGQPGTAGQPPYGEPQQPYGQGQYPYATGPGSDIDVMEAFKYGWEKFKENISIVLAGVVIYVVAIGILVGVTIAIVLGAVKSGNAAGASLGFLSLALVSGIAIILGVFMQASVVRVALEIARGRPVSVASFFQFENFGKIIVTVLIIGVASGLLTVTVVGPLAVSLFSQFALLFVIDKGLDPIEGIKASVNMVLKNLNISLLLMLGVAVLTAATIMTFGLGVFVAVPVSLLATTYVYLRINGEIAAV